MTDEVKAVTEAVEAAMEEARFRPRVFRCHECSGTVIESELYHIACDENGHCFVLRSKKLCVRCLAKYRPKMAAELVASGVVAPEPGDL